jgi:hypothetical protein
MPPLVKAISTTHTSGIEEVTLLRETCSRLMLTIAATAEIVTRRQCSFCGFYPGKVVPISPTPHTISAGGGFNLARLVKARVVRFFLRGYRSCRRQRLAITQDSKTIASLWRVVMANGEMIAAYPGRNRASETSEERRSHCRGQPYKVINLRDVQPRFRK